MVPAALQGNWNYPTGIRFGPGRIAELPELCRELGMHRPLLITDRGLAHLAITARAVDINESAGLPTAIFAAVDPNPGGSAVTAGAKLARAGNHDGVIAFGGGSALDVAKAVALVAHQGRPLWDFEDIGSNYTRVREHKLLPVVAVPTTSGTGSEVGRASVIVHEHSHRKAIIFHPKMLPARVLCDPELTLELPAEITAAVGMDALSHNLEALCAPGFHPMADGIAIEAIRLISQALLAAFRDGSDIEARSRMMAASLMGATAFQKGLGAMHSMSHAMGGALNSPHGLSNAVVMPYVMVFNRAAIEASMTQLGRTLGLQKGGFEGVLQWVLKLRESLQIPHTTAALGCTAEHASLLAPVALADSTAPTNPVPLTQSTMEQLFLNALQGKLS
ncbi:MAG: alcohol dehydrogenase [Rickettsiales bacterium]|nr:alcohol dehydrogenase [Rickettsiales bacterium]